MNKEAQVRALASEIADDLTSEPEISQDEDERRWAASQFSDPDSDGPGEVIDWFETQEEPVYIDAPRRKTSYPQVYDAEGTWQGFFISEAAAQAWMKEKGSGYTMNHLSPPRKIRAS